MLTRHKSDYIKLALPKGRLLPATAHLLNEVRLGFESYLQTRRIYRMQSKTIPNLSAQIFQEKDIPIQVAVGNYDLGICGLDWIEELLARYPASALVKIADLNYNKGNLYLAASQWGDISSLDTLLTMQDNWCIVSEYPNLAEASALGLRLKRFKIFPIWGAAEAYPPDNADLAVLWAKAESEVRAQHLVPLKALLPSGAFLIANRESWQTKNISQIVASLSHSHEIVSKLPPQARPRSVRKSKVYNLSPDEEAVWLAIPDGHQQTPTSKLLAKAGIRLQGYSEIKLNRRPASNLAWIKVKVIRPQDMPLQIANGNFNLAITGRDWLLDHLYRFPTSPATELAELGFGGVKIVAAVNKNLPVNNIEELKQFIKAGKLSPLRVASEYINIADKYLCDNHISPYKLIPTWGASEAFLPEDADMLIENTQTGETLAKHDLKVIDILFHSTACLIGNKNDPASPAKIKRITALVEILHQAAENNN